MEAEVGEMWSRVEERGEPLETRKVKELIVP